MGLFNLQVSFSKICTEVEEARGLDVQGVLVSKPGT